MIEYRMKDSAEIQVDSPFFLQLLEENFLQAIDYRNKELNTIGSN